MRRVSSGDLRRFVPNITTGMGMKYQQVPGDQDSPLLVKESNWYLSIIDKTIGIWGNNDAFPFYIFVKTEDDIKITNMWQFLLSLGIFGEEIFCLSLLLKRSFDQDI